MNLDNLSYLHLDLTDRDSQNQNRELYNLVYKSFVDTWKDGNKEIHLTDTLYSDSFLFNCSADILMFHGFPIAMNFYRGVNFQLDYYASQYWLSYWPSDLVQSFGDHRNVCLANHYTVHPDFRKNNFTQFDTSMVLCSMIILNNYHYQTDLMLGMMNLNRGMNRICEYTGAISHNEKVPLGGILVDLVSYTQESMGKAVANYDSNIVTLFEEGKVYGVSRISKLFSREDEQIYSASGESRLAG